MDQQTTDNRVIHRQKPARITWTNAGRLAPGIHSSAPQAPLIPSLGEVLNQVLSAAKPAAFTAVLRPLVEPGVAGTERQRPTRLP